MWLHLKYTSQRPCWLRVILCCMIFMIWLLSVLNVMFLFFFFFPVARSICTVCVLCYKWQIHAKRGLMWHVLGGKASRLVCQYKHVPFFGQQYNRSVRNYKKKNSSLTESSLSGGFPAAPKALLASCMFFIQSKSCIYPLIYRCTPVISPDLLYAPHQCIILPTH